MKHRTSTATSATLPLQLCHVVITPGARTFVAQLLVELCEHHW